MDNNLVESLLARMNDLIEYQNRQLTQIQSAVVHSVNQDHTVDICIPPSSTVYHNIQNQSIYQNLQPGDNVKIIVENGSLSNMWIIGGFNLSAENQRINRIDVDLIYPIGSIYISAAVIDPGILFGGEWEKIQDKFLLAAGDDNKAGTIGGEKEHILSISEMPSHKHDLYAASSDGNILYYDATLVCSSGEMGLLKKSPETNYRSIEWMMECGGNRPHNNMPPYLTVYMWKRVK